MPFSKVAHYVELNYYPDKELLVSVLTDCNSGGGGAVVCNAGSLA